MSDPAELLSQLSTRLREARKARGLSLDAVAKLSGVSRSMVSQIERGESSPTVATLWNLTRALQVDFAGLLDQATSAPAIEIVRDAQVPVIDGLGQGCRIRILSEPQQAGRHEVYDIRFAPDGSLVSDPHAPGATEALTVVSGRVRVKSGEVEEVLREGDTARYPADVPHAIRADSAARVFLVVHDS
jgi:transcriptional regulator with XRE-family HTH domain